MSVEIATDRCEILRTMDENLKSFIFQARIYVQNTLVLCNFVKLYISTQLILGGLLDIHGLMVHIFLILCFLSFHTFAQYIRTTYLLYYRACT